MYWKEKLFKEIIVEGSEEHYQFIWLDKCNAICFVNIPMTDTLGLCRGESVDFNTTQFILASMIRKVIQ